MKKSAIVRIVIWSVVALLLGSLLYSALVFDTAGSFFGNFSLGFSSFRYNDEGYSKGNLNTGAEIDTFKIYWIGGKIDISSYDGSEIEAVESSDYNIDKENTMRYLIDDGTLTIRARKPGFLFPLSKKQNKTLTIRIPQSLAGKISLLQIDSVSAGVRLSDVSAQKFRLDNVSGDVTLSNGELGVIDIDNVSGKIECKGITADSLMMDTFSGECKFNGSVKKIDFDSFSGGIDIHSSVVPEEIDTDTFSGDAIFRIPKGPGFTAHLDTASGDLNCNLPTVISGKALKQGDGSAKYEFESFSGDASLIIE